MQQIATGIHQVSRGVNAFIVDGDDGVVLVDTGLPNRHGAILDGLATIGRKPGDITAIVVTHGHADHAGGAAGLKRESDAALIASETDAAVVRGDAPAPPPPILDFPIIRGLARLVPTAEGAVVDHLVTTGPVPVASDLTAVPTPGHTAGHISLLLDRHGGVLFAGDSALSTRSGGVQRGYMNRKSATFDSSLRAMAALDFEIACFGHSAAIVGGAGGSFRAFVGGI
ncbi:MAG: MBL fold metallo-hydrolase [Acidimicrobiia bacterium]|nr:MBL fold metallo-hydrolase [Acidimicrobiia bacterium]